MSDKESNEGKNELLHVDGMFQDWFLDYASYVILERAVPALEDGLKPVQRRILHALNEMDDGRFNKVANVIGQTMQYHPHGDASIGDALVNIGQKELLFDIQGNWGDIRTGDSAAAPRYIEVRLSAFAKEVVFNPETTEWQLSYDGRKKEPVNLPVKFPLLLSQGVEGIAVGLSTKILPHNFIELCKGSIDILKGKKVKLYPDFLTGGLADVSEYEGGSRGGKVKVRARIEALDKKTLVIREIPYGTTTGSLIESILKANDKGKIKIKKVVDNTAKEVEVIIELAPGTDPDVTIDALYAFTDCQMSISVNACVIINDKPVFMSVDEILKNSTHRTLGLLEQELNINKAKLAEEWHFASLEKIFIEKRIYRKIEECESWEEVISAIDSGLKPYKKMFLREITREDILRLTEIKIKRISKYDAFRADEHIRGLEAKQKEVEHHLAHLTDYAIAYFEELLRKYAKGRERRTELKGFEQIEVHQVAANNARLYVNREEGFVGTALKKDEFVCECSDLDDIIVFTRAGKLMLTRLGDKKFVGKDIIHVAVWKKNDERTTYNVAYYDGKVKRTFAKRFHAVSLTRDKEYDFTQGTPGSKVLYFSVNPNAEAEVVRVQLHPSSTARIKEFEFDFGNIAIRNRSSMGNIITKFPIRKMDLLEKGASSIGGIHLWLDEEFGRLSSEEKGKSRYLGEFDTGDKILVAYRNGDVELTGFELTNRYDMDDIVFIARFAPEGVYNAVYYDGKTKQHFVKRFKVELKTEKFRSSIVTDHRDSRLLVFTETAEPRIEFHTIKGKTKEKTREEVTLTEIVEVKGWKTLGNRLSAFPVSGKLVLLNPPAPPEPGAEKATDKKVNIKSGKQGDLF